jgi:hypothetical protein
MRREVGIGVRLPANHDEIAGEVAQQNSVLNLRVLCGTSHASCTWKREACSIVIRELYLKAAVKRTQKQREGHNRQSDNRAAEKNSGSGP